jgi:hypothetical protein
MPRSRCVQTVAVLALLAAPQLAAAGPIEWSIRGAPDVDPPASLVFLGVYDAYGLDGKPTPYYALAGLPEGMSGVGQDTMTGVRVGVLSKQAYQLFYIPPPGILTDNPFTWKVSVTDTASGETGVVSFPITATLARGNADLTNSEVFLSGSGEGAFRLGRNEFAVRAWTSESETGLWVVANVGVAPAAATPEPGTLALAGLGLGGGRVDPVAPTAGRGYDARRG